MQIWTAHLWQTPPPSRLVLGPGPSPQILGATIQMSHPLLAAQGCGLQGLLPSHAQFQKTRLHGMMPTHQPACSCWRAHGHHAALSSVACGADTCGSASGCIQTLVCNQTVLTSHPCKHRAPLSSNNPKHRKPAGNTQGSPNAGTFSLQRWRTGGPSFKERVSQGSVTVQTTAS